jgi:thioredoxin 1
MAQEVTDQNFKQEVLEGDKVVLVDFWAPWCGPCKMQGPIVEELSNDFANEAKVKVMKMNVDENPEVSQQYSILSIPTLKIFKGGEIVADMVGLQSKESLASQIKKQLS